TRRCDGPAEPSTTMAGTPPEFVTGSWRRIVPPAFAPNSEGTGGTTWGRGAGAATSFTRNATLPNVMTSFSPATASVMRAPFRKVPLEEPTSLTLTPPSVRLSSACRREIVGSKMGTSLVTARPTTTVRPGFRSIDCSPVVLKSLNTGLPIYSSRRLGQRQCLQHGLRLVLRLQELARRVRVGDDAGAGLDHDPVLQHHGGADRDGGVEARGAPPDVTHRPGVRPPALGLEL